MAGADARSDRAAAPEKGAPPEAGLESRRVGDIATAATGESSKKPLAGATPAALNGI